MIGVRVPAGAEIFFSSPLRPDRLWDPPTQPHNLSQHYPEDGGSMEIWNVDILPQQYTASQPIRCRQHGSLESWYPTTTLHGVTTQKTSTSNIVAVKASKLAKYISVSFTSNRPSDFKGWLFNKRHFISCIFYTASNDIVITGSCIFWKSWEI
jgi:hypothetical protein